MHVAERIKQEDKTGRVGGHPVARRVVFVTGGMGGIGSAIEDESGASGACRSTMRGI